METKRVTLSLPISLVHNLTYIAERLGVSRSALVGELMTEPVGDIYNLLKVIPTDPNKVDDDVRKRARGDSKALVEARMDQLRRAADDLHSRIDPQS